MVHLEPFRDKITFISDRLTLISMANLNNFEIGTGDPSVKLKNRY